MFCGNTAANLSLVRFALARSNDRSTTRCEIERSSADVIRSLSPPGPPTAAHCCTQPRRCATTTTPSCAHNQQGALEAGPFACHGYVTEQQKGDAQGNSDRAAFLAQHRHSSAMYVHVYTMPCMAMSTRRLCADSQLFSECCDETRPLVALVPKLPHGQLLLEHAHRRARHVVIGERDPARRSEHRPLIESHDELNQRFFKGRHCTCPRSTSPCRERWIS